MPVLSLPLTFGNSFWSQDYRKGLQVVYTKLEQGADENDEVVNLIRARATAERALGNALASPAPTGPRGRGFGADDGASLLVSFRCLQQESTVQGKAHLTLAKELDTTVADPFEEWAHAHKERVRASKDDMLNGWLLAYEDGVSDVTKLKKKYLDKTRKADEAEDDAKFAPNYAPSNDPYTASPKINQSHGTVQRTPSVSERIQQRLAELQNKKSDAPASATSPTEKPIFSAPASEKDETETTPTQILDKGKGKAVDEHPASPLPMSPPPMSPALPPARITSPTTANLIPPPPLPILLAEVSFQPAAVSALLLQAQQRLPLRAVRFPIIGEYQNVFSGEEFTTWLVENVPEFKGNLDVAEEAARELTERESALRRIGEFGNKFENSPEAYFQFRAKAFDLGNNTVTRHADVIGSPNDDATAMPFSARIAKRSGTLANFVSSVMASTGSTEPPYVRARQEALEASQAYRVAVRGLDRRRLALEARVEETLKTLQTWERDRLRAVKTVLGQYQAALGALHPALKDAIERSNEFVNSFRPENDLVALIERYRTGPFRPSPQVFESASHVVADVVFGIDLTSWAGEGGWNAVRAAADGPKDTIPPVLRDLLTGLVAAYAKMGDDDQRRKSWIYDVPLPAIHHLRENINALPAGTPIPAELLDKYDAPVIAGTIKIWFLELSQPVATWEGWDEIRKIYPSVGADSKPEETGTLAHIDDIKNALYRLPKVHLQVLDAFIQHLNQLIEKTASVDEDKEVYLTKLALSVGRTIVRPKVETEMSIQDRHPTLFFLDLLKHYTETLPPTITKKKRDSERPVPTKKRTAPIDVRMSRSRLSAQGLDAKQAYQQISHSRNASRGRGDSSASAGHPPVPPLPEAPSSATTVAPPPPPPQVAPAQPVQPADPNAPPPRP
ncbi:hypothetical protein BKA62DRAFT_591337, partial [Auriculariales sp. MPI-PUGE-AT-0066]